jgi:hypothetical protein
MRIALLRVGLDTGCRPTGLGPIFIDSSFELVWIPDSLDEDERCYGNTSGRHGRPFTEYLSPSQRPAAAGRSMHVDPEFETFTYGDPTTQKVGLKRLRPGDVLAFYAGLRPYGFEGADALYLIGYFVTAEAVLSHQIDNVHRAQFFQNNAHVRNPKRYARDRDHLMLIRGGPESRLFERAVRISRRGKDRRGHPLHIQSDEMLMTFGDFGGQRSIQRSPPRWVAPDHTETAWQFLRTAGFK